MADENILLFETKHRNLGFLVYDECRKTGGSYLTIEMKVVGDTIKVYAVPFYSDLQPGPRASYDESMAKLRGLVVGVEAGYKQRG